jgi:hypothetical protein
MNLTRLSEFIQVLRIKRDDSTKDECFSKQEQITMIYLLQNKD